MNLWSGNEMGTRIKAGAEACCYPMGTDNMVKENLMCFASVLTVGGV
jgi:hypothetical protein